MDMYDRLKAVNGFWYLGTPYRKYPGGIELAFDHAALISGLLMKQGVKLFSPIAHSHAIAKASGIDPLDDSFWISMFAPVIEASCGLITAKMVSWEISNGLNKEIEIYESAGKPHEKINVFYTSGIISIGGLD